MIRRSRRMALNLALAAAVSGALAMACVDGAAAGENRRTMTLSGVGEVYAMPDMATVSFGVQTRAKTARRALSENTAKMRKVFATLKGKWHIAEKDMITSDFSIQPVYRQVKMAEYGREIVKSVLDGYRVRNMLQVRVRNLEDLGGVLDSVVSSGVNRIDAVSFGFSDPASLRQEARKRAVRNVLAKAKTIAAEGGFALGPVLNVREQGAVMPPPRPYMAMRKAVMAQAVPVPVAHGERKISVRVTFVWEIR